MFPPFLSLLVEPWSPLKRGDDMPFYISDGAALTEVKTLYLSNGMALEQLKKLFASNGTSLEEVFGGGELAYYGTVPFYSSSSTYYVGNEYTSGASSKNHALFTGDFYDYRPKSGTVRAYSANLVASDASPVLTAKYLPAGITHPMGYAVFGPGMSYAGGGSRYGVHTIDIYSDDLVRTNLTPLYNASDVSTGVVGKNGIVASGARDHDGDSSNYYTTSAYAITENLVLVSLSNITQYSSGKSIFKGVSSGNNQYVIFPNYSGYTATVYDENLTKYGTITIPHKNQIGTVKAGEYALLGGGYVSSSDRPTNVVVAIDSNLVSTTPTPLSVSRTSPGTNAIENFGMFENSYGSSLGSMDVYDENLTRKNIQQNIALGDNNWSATNVGNYVLWIPGTRQQYTFNFQVYSV